MRQTGLMVVLTVSGGLVACDSAAVQGSDERLGENAEPVAATADLSPAQPAADTANSSEVALAATTAIPVPKGAKGRYEKLVLNSDFTKLPLPEGGTTSADILENSRYKGTRIDLGSGLQPSLDGGKPQMGPVREGYDWYLTCDFCLKTTRASALSVIKDPNSPPGAPHSVLRIDGTDSTGIVGQAPDTAIKGQADGHAFANGAYFEARLAMGQPVNKATFWPQFTALPNFSGISIAWPGTTTASSYTCADGHLLDGGTFETDVEIDTLELLPANENAHETPGVASATWHSWYGAYYCTDKTGPTRDAGQEPYSQYHAGSKAYPGSDAYASTEADPHYNTFGVLWVPSKKTPQGYTQGFMQFYYNNETLGPPITWIGTPPPASNPEDLLLPRSHTKALANKWVGEPADGGLNVATPEWIFGSTDLYSYALAFGTGGGAFMNVQWVRAWQAE